MFSFASMRFAVSSAAVLAALSGVGAWANKPAVPNPTATIPQANKLAYDSYNFNGPTQEVIVEGIVTVPQRITRAIVTGPSNNQVATFEVLQEGQYSNSFTIQDATVRTINGTVYSGAIKVFLGAGGGQGGGNVPLQNDINDIGGRFSGWPVNLTHRNNIGVPKVGDRVVVRGRARIELGFISAQPITGLGAEPVVDLSARDSGNNLVYPVASNVWVLSENNPLPAPIPVTPSTFAQAPFQVYPGSALAGDLGRLSQKGVKGSFQGNINVNPLIHMRVILTGARYMIGNPLNFQQTFPVSVGGVGAQVGFHVADLNDIGKTVHVKLRHDTAFQNVRVGTSTFTRREPSQFSFANIFAGDTAPIIGTVATARILLGSTDRDLSVVFPVSPSDVGVGQVTQPSSVLFTEIQNQGDFPGFEGTAPLPGTFVEVRVSTNENSGTANVVADLSAFGQVTDMNNNPITQLQLTPLANDLAKYVGRFRLTPSTVQGRLPIRIRYQKGPVNQVYDSDSPFHAALNALAFRTLGELKLASYSLSDGAPVALSPNVPGTQLPIVTFPENAPAGFTIGAANLWIADQTGVAGINVFNRGGQSNNPITRKGDLVSVYGQLGTFRGGRQINLPNTNAIRVIEPVDPLNPRPVPRPLLINLTDVSADMFDATWNGITTLTGGQPLPVASPATLAGNQGLEVTVVGRVINAPSRIVDADPAFQVIGGVRQWSSVDITDGQTIRAITFNQRSPEWQPNFGNYPQVGDVIIATGIAHAAGTSSSNIQGQKVYQVIWTSGPEHVIKNPTVTPVTVNVPAGATTVSLPALPDPTPFVNISGTFQSTIDNITYTSASYTVLPNAPAIFQNVNAYRKYGNQLFAEGSVPQNPLTEWWKGFQFVRIGEAYRIDPPAAATSFTYNAIVSGTGTDLTGQPRAFNLDTDHNRWYPVYNTPGQSALIATGTSNGIAYDPKSETSQALFSEGGQLFTSPFAIASEFTDNGQPVAPPVNLLPSRGYGLTPTVADSFVFLRTNSDALQTNTLSGQIRLSDDFTGPKTAVPFTVELRAPGLPGAVLSYVVNVDANNQFSISGIPAGIYDVVARAPFSLGFKVDNVNLFSNATVALLGPGGAGLVLGDSDQNGAIDDADLTNIILDFGGAGGSSSGFATDFNGDGIVDDADLTILILGFGQTGP